MSFTSEDIAKLTPRPIVNREQFVKNVRLRLCERLIGEKDSEGVPYSEKAILRKYPPKLVNEVLRAFEEEILCIIAEEKRVDFAFGAIQGEEKPPRKVQGYARMGNRIQKNGGYTDGKRGFPRIGWSRLAKQCEVVTPFEFFERKENRYTSDAYEFRKMAELEEIPEFQGLPLADIQKICAKADEINFNKLTRADQISKLKNAKHDRKKDIGGRILRELFSVPNFMESEYSTINAKDAVDALKEGFYDPLFNKNRVDVTNARRLEVLRRLIDLSEFKYKNIDKHQDLFEEEKRLEKLIEENGETEFPHENFCNIMNEIAARGVRKVGDKDEFGVDFNDEYGGIDSEFKGGFAQKFNYLLDFAPKIDEIDFEEYYKYAEGERVKDFLGDDKAKKRRVRMSLVTQDLDGSFWQYNNGMLIFKDNDDYESADRLEKAMIASIDRNVKNVVEREKILHQNAVQQKARAENWIKMFESKFYEDPYRKDKFGRAMYRNKETDKPSSRTFAQIYRGYKRFLKEYDETEQARRERVKQYIDELKNAGCTDFESYEDAVGEMQNYDEAFASGDTERIKKATKRWWDEIDERDALIGGSGNINSKTRKVIEELNKKEDKRIDKLLEKIKEDGGGDVGDGGDVEDKGGDE